MTATPEELLRLAREAWPGSRPHLLDVHEVLICDSANSATRVGVDDENPTHRAAIHALLLVLAGELDVAALLAERDRLRRRVDEAVRNLDYREFFGRYRIADMDAAMYLDQVIARLKVDP